MFKKNRILLCLLTLAIVLSSFTVVSAAEIEVTGADYAALQAAVDGAGDGDTIKLTCDIYMGNSTLVIAQDDNITLDLNGYKISGSSDTVNHAMIRNNGSLVITGNGVITYEYTGVADETYGTGNYTIVNGGALVVENGTIANTTAAMSHAYFAIDNNSTSHDVSLVVNGGKIICDNYRSIRQFANSETRKNDVVINGGQIVGQVWTQSTNAKANLASLEINGGTFKPMGKDGSAIYVTNGDAGMFDVEVAGGYFEGKIGTDKPAALDGAIVGGTFTEAAKEGTNADLFADDFVLKANADGTYTAVKEDVSDSTVVEYVGQGTEEYEISVPMKLAPGESGSVKVSGTWAAHRELSVEVPNKVTMVHNLFKADTKVLDVVFSGIERVGDNCYSVSDEGIIWVSEIENALFGTWTGTIVYTVRINDVA